MLEKKHFSVLKEGDDKVLVITPLFLEHEIADYTKECLNKNKINYSWISYKSEKNVYENTEIALNIWLKENKEPKYIIKIDNDVFLSDNYLDILYNTFEKCSDANLAFVYSDFSFIKENKIFYSSIGQEFSKERLKQGNYINSNFLLKYNSLKAVNGFVTDKKYERLLDWCLLLKLIKFGFIGKRAENSMLKAFLNKDSVSARSKEDYIEKYNNVKKDFLWK